MNTRWIISELTKRGIVPAGEFWTDAGPAIRFKTLNALVPFDDARDAAFVDFFEKEAMRYGLIKERVYPPPPENIAIGGIK